MIESVSDLVLGILIGFGGTITALLVFAMMKMNLEYSIKKEIGFYETKEKEYDEHLKNIIRDVLKENKLN